MSSPCFHRMSEVIARKSQTYKSGALTFHCHLMLPSARMCKQVHLNGDFSHRVIHTST